MKGIEEILTFLLILIVCYFIAIFTDYIELYHKELILGIIVLFGLGILFYQLGVL